MNITLIYNQEFHLSGTQKIYGISDVTEYFDGTIHSKIHIPGSDTPKKELTFYYSEYQITGGVKQPVDIFTDIKCIPLDRWIQILCTKYTDISNIAYVSGNEFKKIPEYNFPISFLKNDGGEKYIGIFHILRMGDNANLIITLTPAKEFLAIKELHARAKICYRFLHL